MLGYKILNEVHNYSLYNFKKAMKDLRRHQDNE